MLFNVHHHHHFDDDTVVKSLVQVLRQLFNMEDSLMATKEVLDRLIADVTANTNATAAAAQALTGFQATVADLTQKLQDAIAGAGNVDPAIVDAAAALEANNATLTAATPAVACLLYTS